MAMSSFIKTTIAFILGGAIGSAVTYKMTRDKCQAFADEQIESVREMYRNKERGAKEHSEAKKNNPDLANYEAVCGKNGYRDYSTQSKIIPPPTAQEPMDISPEPAVSDNSDENDKMKKEPKIYEISPEEFVKVDEFDQVSLTYYTNHVFATDDGTAMGPDIITAVGEDFEKYFGHYESDAAYICNEILGTKYEIIREHCDYDEWPEDATIGGEFNY